MITNNVTDGIYDNRLTINKKDNIFTNIHAYQSIYSLHNCILYNYN